MSKHSGVNGKTVPALHRSMAAAKRVAERAQRDAKAQLALLDTRPGASQRERIRLGYQLLRDSPEMAEIASEAAETTTRARTRRRANRKAGRSA